MEDFDYIYSEFDPLFFRGFLSLLSFSEKILSFF